MSGTPGPAAWWRGAAPTAAQEPRSFRCFTEEVREMVQIKIRKLDKLETTGPRKPADG
ncbi:hypothetical protein GCM10010299_43740 [Streptomyces tanashiensis]|nr:hypothetical protein GCM10010299_43740 [Streptomyces tanashiensis]